MTIVLSKYRGSLQAKCLFNLLLVALFAAGCKCANECIDRCMTRFFVGTPVTHTGTFVGRAESCRLCSRDNKSFPVIAFDIDGAIGTIKTEGSCAYRDFIKWRTIVFLVDDRKTAYSPDKYVGKRLKVEGTIQWGNPHPFPDGPELNDPSGVLQPVVLVAKTIQIDNSTEQQSEAKPKG